MNPQTTLPGFMVKSTVTSKCPFAFRTAELVKVKVPNELVIVSLPGDCTTQISASECPETCWNAANSPAWLLLLRFTRVGPDRVAFAREAIPPQSTPIINMYFNDFMLYLGWCTD